jgi:hypothetical protein
MVSRLFGFEDSRMRGDVLPTRSTIPSATPRAQAASTLPPTYLIVVFVVVAFPFVVGTPCFDSKSAKYFSERFTKLETIFFPTNSSGFVIGPFSGT